MKFLLTALITLYPVFLGQDDVQLHQLEVKFNQPNLLVIGSPVFVGSQKVGRVTSLEEDGASVEVQLSEDPVRLGAIVTNVMSGEKIAIIELFPENGSFSSNIESQNSLEQVWAAS